MSAVVLFLAILGMGFLALLWLGVALSIVLQAWGRARSWRTSSTAIVRV